MLWSSSVHANTFPISSETSSLPQRMDDLRTRNNRYLTRTHPILEVLKFRPTRRGLFEVVRNACFGLVNLRKDKAGVSGC